MRVVVREGEAMTVRELVDHAFLWPSDRCTLTRADIREAADALDAKIAADKAEIERLRELADKYKWQVRDTCTRAEKAEAQLATARQEGRDEALEEAAQAGEAEAERWALQWASGRDGGELDVGTAIRALKTAPPEVG